MHRECVYKLGQVSTGQIWFMDISHCDTDISPTTLSHRQIATHTENLQILKDSIQCSTIFTKIGIKIFLELMHRECVYKLWASINRPDLSYGHLPVVTLIEAPGHLSMSKMHTKSQITQFERSQTVQHNFYSNLDKIFLELMHRECVYKLWVIINRPDLVIAISPL